MGRQFTNTVLVVGGIIFLIFGGTMLLDMIGILPQEYVDMVLQGIVRMYAALPR